MIFRPSCAFSPSINVSFASQTFYRNQTYSFTVVSSAASGSYFFECVGWVLAPQNFAAPFSAEFQLFKNASSSYPLNRATTASSNSIVLSSASSSSNPFSRLNSTPATFASVSARPLQFLPKSFSSPSIKLPTKTSSPKRRSPPIPPSPKCPLAPGLGVAPSGLVSSSVSPTLEPKWSASI